MTAATTAPPDLIVGRGGVDYMYGKAGNDRMRGGKGSDVLVGEGGDDRIWGGPGRDALYGLDGSRDWLDGGPAYDHCSGEKAVRCERMVRIAGDKR